jgi:hypothetical protein
MPKVPDLLTSQSNTLNPGQGSLGSEGQTAFAQERMIFADKPLLSPIEQRIKSVAEATRMQIAVRDWMR